MCTHAQAHEQSGKIERPRQMGPPSLSNWAAAQQTYGANAAGRIGLRSRRHRSDSIRPEVTAEAMTALLPDDVDASGVPSGPIGKGERGLKKQPRMLLSALPLEAAVLCSLN